MAALAEPAKGCESGKFLGDGGSNEHSPIWGLESGEESTGPNSGDDDGEVAVDDEGVRSMLG